MINIIKQNGQLNPQLKSFPSSSLTISIFGTQSTGKSTLLNSSFNSNFPILNSKQQRKRCTSGIWLQHIKTQQQQKISHNDQQSSSINIIDTQGFDSIQRSIEQKIIQKQFALFCLVISDVIIINLWMTQIGRYQGTHCNILKDIIKVSERLIKSNHTNQEKRIIFVVKDCQNEVDKNVLKQELESNINAIIKQIQIQRVAQNNNNNNNNNNKYTNRSSKLPKLSLQYHFMSHFYYKPQKYLLQAKQLRSLILSPKHRQRKSFLSYYSGQDKIIYLQQLWSKIRSKQYQIDLKSIQSALTQHSLTRILHHTLSSTQLLISSFSSFSTHHSLPHKSSYSSFSSSIHKQSILLFNQQKPILIKDKQIIQKYYNKLYEEVQYRINKQFIDVILINEENMLLDKFDHMLKQTLKKKNKKIEKVLVDHNKQIIDKYKIIVKQHKQQNILYKKFTQRLQSICLKYYQQIQHNFNIFQTTLQKQLSQILNTYLTHNLFTKTFQLQPLSDQLHTSLTNLCTSNYYNQWQININQIWQNIITRTLYYQLPQIIKQHSQKQYNNGNSIWIADRIKYLVAFHKKMEYQCEHIVKKLINVFQDNDIKKNQINQDSHIDSNVKYKLDKIKELINQLIIKTVQKQVNLYHYDQNIKYRKKDSISILSSYHQFTKIIKFFIKKKKKRIYFLNFYIFIGFIFLIIAIYNRKDKIIEIINKKQQNIKNRNNTKQ